jgi:hypothetical protein
MRRPQTSNMMMMELSALYLSTHNGRRTASYAGSQSEKSYDKYGWVLLQNVVEKRVLDMSKTREEALASIQKRLVCLQDSIKWKTEPLDYNAKQSQEIATMRTLLAITYEFLPDEIALQIKATLDIKSCGIFIL